MKIQTTNMIKFSYNATIVQSVLERTADNGEVGGSSPPSRTIKFPIMKLFCE